MNDALALSVDGGGAQRESRTGKQLLQTEGPEDVLVVAVAGQWWWRRRSGNGGGLVVMAEERR